MHGGEKMPIGTVYAVKEVHIRKTNKPRGQRCQVRVDPATAKKRYEKSGKTAQQVQTDCSHASSSTAQKSWQT